jgi:transcriptional/translational regulatory protein YebC/TACO1
VDREAIVRGERRRRIEEALDEERGREEALVERLAEVVTEEEGTRIDEQAFARMDPEDVALVREALEEPSAFDVGEEDADFLALESDEDDQTEAEEEIARLQAEIAASRRRRLAYERYLEALDS